MRVASNQIVAGDYDYIGQKINENTNRPMTTTTNLLFTPNDWFFCIFILRCCVFFFSVFFAHWYCVSHSVVLFSLASLVNTKHFDVYFIFWLSASRCVRALSCQNCVPLLLVTENKIETKRKGEARARYGSEYSFFSLLLLLVSFDCWLRKCLSHDTYFKRHMSSEAALYHNSICFDWLRWQPNVFA